MIKKRILLFLFCLSLALTGGTFIDQPHAYACGYEPYWSTCGAAGSCDPYFGTCGYFYNRNEGAGTTCNVLPNSDSTVYCKNNGYISGSSCVGDCSKLFGVTDRATFIQVIHDYLYRPSLTTNYDYNSEIGAAYIVDFMMGMKDFHNGTTWGGGIGDAQNVYNTWQAMVNNYAVAGHTCVGSAVGVQCPGALDFGINWKYTPSFSSFCSSTTRTLESEYDPSVPDVAEWPAFNNDALSKANCTTAYNHSLPEIVFYWTNSDGSLGTMSIGTMCGNIQGSPTGPMPMLGITCGGANVVPARLDPYMQFGVTVSVQNSTASPPPAGTFTLTITPPGAGGYALSNAPKAGVVSGSSESAAFTGLGPPRIAGNFAVQWAFTPTGLPTAATCSGSFSVAYLPYLGVYGGDVYAGNSPSYNTATDTSSCGLPGTGAGIFSWNSGAPNYTGAGTQYAVQALAGIVGFASAQGSTNSPTGLSFANYFNPPDLVLDKANGKFGGDAAMTTGNCDFTSDLTGATVLTGDQTLTLAPNMTSNNNVYYVKNGNVFINSNITYSQSSWASPSQIPYFKLVVVGGNIYIGSNVTELDGIFVAEPTSAANGYIYTCASGNGAYINPTVAGGYSLCKTKLTVYGAFVAQNFAFGRTAGSVGQSGSDTAASNNDAEVFYYTPEVWLPRGTGTPGDEYDTVAGLPPVL